jgi:large subunit ribosomal protein L31
LIDTAGRIDKFKTKYAKFKKPAAVEVKTEE